MQKTKIENPATAGVGTLFSGRPRTFSRARVLAFSGGFLDQLNWPDKNLHTDEETARQAGLDNIIVSGTQSEGILIGFLITVCGPRWHTRGSLELRFVKKVDIDESVHPKLRLTRRTDEPSGKRVTFDAWCENSAGDTVIVGEASCLFEP